MRRTALFSIVAAVGLSVALGVLAGGHEQKPSPVDKKIMLVPGGEPWTPTELMVLEKDRVTLTATGKVCFSAGDPKSCQGPEGWGRSQYVADWPDNANACDDPYPQFNHAMLIGKVGDDVFPVGASKVFTNREGPLELGINDCSFTGPFHNTGQYSVIIRVERGPQK